MQKSRFGDKSITNLDSTELLLAKNLNVTGTIISSDVNVKGDYLTVNSDSSNTIASNVTGVRVIADPTMDAHLAAGQSETNAVFLKWTHNGTPADATADLCTFAGNNNMTIQCDGGTTFIGKNDSTADIVKYGKVITVPPGTGTAPINNNEIAGPFINGTDMEFIYRVGGTNYTVTLTGV